MEIPLNRRQISLVSWIIVIAYVTLLVAGTTTGNEALVLAGDVVFSLLMLGFGVGLYAQYGYEIPLMTVAAVMLFVSGLLQLAVLFLPVPADLEPLPAITVLLGLIAYFAARVQVNRAAS